MSKNLKLRIKNEQLAKGLNLSKVKSKLSKKKAAAEEEEQKKPAKTAEAAAPAENAAAEAEQKPKRKARARSKSAFAQEEEQASEAAAVEEAEEKDVEAPAEEEAVELEAPEIVEEPPVEEPEKAEEQVEKVEPVAPEPVAEEPAPVEEAKAPEPKEETPAPVEEPPPPPPPPKQEKKKEEAVQPKLPPKRRKLGPTGRHINDLLPPKKPTPPPQEKTGGARTEGRTTDTSSRWKGPKTQGPAHTGGGGGGGGGGGRGTDSRRSKTYRDLKPSRKGGGGSGRGFDSRDKQGLRAGEEEGWRRKKRKPRSREQVEDLTIRPSELTVRLPIVLKDLAAEMKLKASQLISKLFMQGMVVTLNDILDDETVVELLGDEFGCKISIDTSEEDRIRITSQSVREEILEADPDKLTLRPPVVTFMGHVDHGKTSLIDRIRSSSIASGEAGAITQHIGAFLCPTAMGDIAILDTPGHEAFSAMRARGAEVTDIVVLVVAGDEGMRQQTVEAIQHAKAANVTIVVAINKCDKPGFNVENVYRQLSEQELMPEAWGGQTITVNTSAVSGEGIDALLEMLALQSEILELNADPTTRARGTVVESEMCKGRGNVARVLVQNGTLHKGDAVVFGTSWGRVKTMHNDQGKDVATAGPSHPVEITGLSALPEAGEDFIVVSDEKEAREIAEARAEEALATRQQRRMVTSLEGLLQQAKDSEKKVLNLVLRADVQGSLEALKTAIMKIESDKVDANIIFTGVGEISESDIQLAAASNAMILGFHTQIESHAEPLIKETGVTVRTHDIIYHAIDEVKALMAGLLDRVAEEKYCGTAEIKATFKSSQLGIIAGCLVTDGTIHRNNRARLIRGGEEIWVGNIASIKRMQDEVKEVNKGFECGIVLEGFKTVEVDDVIEAFEIVYKEQEL